MSVHEKYNKVKENKETEHYFREEVKVSLRR